MISIIFNLLDQTRLDQAKQHYTRQIQHDTAIPCSRLVWVGKVIRVTIQAQLYRLMATSRRCRPKGFQSNFREKLIVKVSNSLSRPRVFYRTLWTLLLALTLAVFVPQLAFMAKRAMPQPIVFVTGNAKKLEEVWDSDKIGTRAKTQIGKLHENYTDQICQLCPQTLRQTLRQPHCEVKQILSSGSEELPFDVTSQKARMLLILHPQEKPI